MLCLWTIPIGQLWNVIEIDTPSHLRARTHTHTNKQLVHHETQNEASLLQSPTF